MKFRSVDVLLGLAVLLFILLLLCLAYANRAEAGGPSCCVQRDIMSAGALGAVNEIGPGENVPRYARGARDRLIKSLEYAVGPCRWEGGRYECDGAR